MNGRCAARLYGRDLPSAGLLVTAWFVGGRLHVDGAASHDVAASQLTVETGGFDHDQLFLAWDSAAGGRLSLTPADAAARATLLGTAPPALEPALRRYQQRNQRERTKWAVLGGVAGVLVLSLFGLWWGYGAVVDWAAEQVPVDVEERLGESTLAQIKSGGKLIEDGPAVEAIRSIGDRLTQGSRYRYRWALLDDPSINAFAAPGGHVVVHRGLIAAAKTPEELAGVLAHEVQHIEQRHTLKSMINGLGVAALATVALGDVSAMAGMLAYQVGTLSYSRDLETEADRLGLAALSRAKIAPEGMARFFRTLAKEAPQMPIALLSSHPATEDRIAAIEAGIRALPKQDVLPLTIDWVAVQDSLPSADPSPSSAPPDTTGGP